MRQKFVEKYAKDPNFAWLKRKAVDARKNKLVQHKHASVRESSGVQKRVKVIRALHALEFISVNPRSNFQALEENGANVTDAFASMLALNKPLSDFLYQVNKKKAHRIKPACDTCRATYFSSRRTLSS